MDTRTPDDLHLGGLMRAAQLGDADAYFAMLQELAPRVRQIGVRRRGALQSADLEDLVQEVLLSIHVARGSYDPSRPFLPWLLAIVRNRLADGARWYARLTAHEVQVENLDVTFADLVTNVVWLPIASASVWITLIGVGALQQAQLSPVPLQADWGCVPATLIGAAIPAAAIAFMLRRGVPLTPRLTAALGALAATGVGNIGICFFQPHHSRLAVLVWHCGTVLVVAALAGMAGGQFLRWRTGRGALVSR